MAVLSSAALAQPAVTVSPTTGPPTDKVAVSGTGFGADEAVNVYFDTTDLALAATGPSGSFTGNNAIGGFYGPFFTPENGLINPPEHTTVDIEIIEQGPVLHHYRMHGTVPDGLLDELKGKQVSASNMKRLVVEAMTGETPVGGDPSREASAQDG